MDVLIQQTTNLKTAVRHYFDCSEKLKGLKNKQVIIKPNWVVPRDSSSGVTTSFALVEELIRALKEKKAKVIICEGAGYEFDDFQVKRILDTAYFTRKFKVPIINSRDCDYQKLDINGKILKEIGLPLVVAKADLIIDVPKFKTHMLTDVSFALKNLLGLIPLAERRKAHAYGIHQAIVDLGKYFSPKSVAIVDCLTAMSGCGPVFGDSLKPGLTISSDSLLAADLACCRVAGINYKNVRHLFLANKQLKVSKTKYLGSKNFRLKNFKLPQPPYFYRFIYRSLYLVEDLLQLFSTVSLVKRIVTSFGARIIIEDLPAKYKKELIGLCPVRAINENLEIDLAKCRYVRCMKCYDRFPEYIKIRGISKPNKNDKL